MRSALISTSVLVIAIASCGDDGGDDTTATTSTLTASTTAPDDTTGASTSAGSTTGTSSSSEGSSSGADGSTSTAGTTGEPEDPSYPAPDDAGGCPPDTAPIQLPGGGVCSPFCAGADAPCPAPVSGDAEPVCTPFEEKGGSGTACTMHADCPAEEACGAMGTCVAVAFWGCRLQCDAGQTCSDGMTCAGDACAYP